MFHTAKPIMLQVHLNRIIGSLCSHNLTCFIQWNNWPASIVDQNNGEIFLVQNIEAHEGESMFEFRVEME